MSTRKIASRPPEPVHRCRLPWWRPFRRSGMRVQCTECDTTWRWDHGETYADYDSGRRWVDETEEARVAAVAEEAERNR